MYFQVWFLGQGFCFNFISLFIALWPLVIQGKLLVFTLPAAGYCLSFLLLYRAHIWTTISDAIKQKLGLADMQESEFW